MRASLAAAGALALAAAAFRPAGHGDAFPQGAPPGFTGGFGEPACTQCHFGGELNEAGGSLEITGLPERYTPGETYRLIVRLRREGIGAAGFQLAARHEDGTQAGRLSAESEDDRVHVQEGRGVQYAGHTEAGSVADAAGAGEWSLVWTAPAHAAPVVFHAAGNAADGDRSPFGDNVYTAEVRVAPGP